MSTELFEDLDDLAEPFVDEPAGPPPIIIDRSTLERYADCPHQGYLVERKMVSTGGMDAEVGSAVHDELSAAVAMRRYNACDPRELREWIEEGALKSRPDLQPEVVAALRRAYPIVDLICRHPSGSPRSFEDILRFDGGDDEAAGQLAADILPADDTRGAVRLTAELDLLMAGASVEELELVDWKSGWRHWTASDVKDSFQFQQYAWLVFRCYPAVQRVRVRVYMTRDGLATSAVEFTRDRDFWQINARLLSAATIYLEHHKAEDPETVPAWPLPDRCSLCPAAQRCRVAHEPERELAVDPVAYLQQYVVLQAATDRMRAAMISVVRKQGRDIVGDGVAFGTGKPKAARAAACDLYEATGRESRKFRSP